MNAIYTYAPSLYPPIAFDLMISIVEDDREIRETLSFLIDNTEGFGCLATYKSAEEAINELPNNPPDVLLMDISLPGISGIQCVKTLKESLPELEVLMLTVHQDDNWVFDALCAGACGYLTKNTPTDKILEAITEVHKGGAPMSTNIARMVVSSFRTPSAKSMLTMREQEVLSQLCMGKSYKLIADALFISQDTVRSHIKHIYKKLEVNSKSEAVAKALKNKWV